MLTNKEILTAVAPNIAVTIVLITIITVLNLSFLLAATLILLYTAVSNQYSIIKGRLSYQQAVINIVSISLLLLLIYLVNTFSGLNPLMSFLVVTGIICAYVLWVRRRGIMDAIRFIEKKHFGETAEERKARLKE